MGVIRDPAKNVCIEFPLERNKAHFLDGFASLLRRSHGRYSPIADELAAVFAAYNDEKLKKLPPFPAEKQPAGASGD